jgi:hypothetical protein
VNFNFESEIEHPIHNPIENDQTAERYEKGAINQCGLPARVQVGIPVEEDIFKVK